MYTALLLQIQIGLSSPSVHQPLVIHGNFHLIVMGDCCGAAVRRLPLFIVPFQFFFSCRDFALHSSLTLRGMEKIHRSVGYFETTEQL